ncbi:MAG: pitrilysin family protein [Flavobacteriales bacterium]
MKKYHVMKSIARIILTLILDFSLSANDQVDRTKAPQSDPAPEINIGQPAIFRLDNGLTILVVENHKLPMVTVSLDFDQDPILEGDKAGLKNIFGDMLRAGTKSHTKEQFDEAIDHLGTTFYVASSGVYMSTLRRHLSESVKLMSEALLTPAFDNTQELQKLIKRSITNIKLNEKDSNAISEHVRKILYYGKYHPYGEYASRESLKKITLRDLKKFYQTYFKPNTAYLVFVGDITKEEAKRLADAHFSAWKKGTIPARKYTIAPLPAQLEIDLVDLPSVTQSNISVGGVVNFKKNAPDYFAALLANGILGGGIQGRLFQNLREQKSYTYGAYSNLVSDKHIGSFYASAQVRTEVTDSAVVELIKELRKITSIPVSPEELEIKKKENIGRFILRLENPRTIINFIISELKEQLPKGFYQNYLKSLQLVTLPQITAAAKRYIPAQNAHILIVGKAEQLLPRLEKLGYLIHFFNK